MTIHRAIEAFAYGDKSGVPRSVAPGDLMSSDDPNFKGREHLFEKVEVAADRQSAEPTKPPKPPTVETATAEPGERRSISTPTPTPPAAGKPAAGPSKGAHQ